MAQNTLDMAMWTDALRAKFAPETTTSSPYTRAEFDQLLGSWSACVDQPAFVFAEELILAYPEAKIILVERDEEKWYKSFSETVIAGSASPAIPYAAVLSPEFLRQYAMQTDLMAWHVFGVTYPHGTRAFWDNGHFFDQWRENARATYRQHYENVKRLAPEDKLLMFDLEHGWEPLCKEVPNVPFPRVNETKIVQEKIQLYIAKSLRRAAVRIGSKVIPALVTLMAVGWYWSRR
ncbi:hypothetical protein LTR78_003920 [Recurvomyces mirabilis]|uniref:Uncharacterized protein n=1 Tax=Recurvomyces mirabilis TaxID=574656 RepID=A0AAE0WQQ8_9PEZI|nr:hypothetical protein LTR78_003920 [Recurvomyces mirabilis]KAK5153942.1 hypothetical protein LTS14_007162 [Recurvomyces mirabilis]